MLQEGAFGPSCGAAGENNIGEAERVRPSSSWRLARIFSNRSPVCVEIDSLCGWWKGYESVDS